MARGRGIEAGMIGAGGGPAPGGEGIAGAAAPRPAKTMTEADVAEENYRQKIEEAGRKTQARKLTADLLDRAQQGTASSEDLLLGLTNGSWLSGTPEGVAQG